MEDFGCRAFHGSILAQACSDSERTEHVLVTRSGPGVTRLSDLARAGSSNDVLARDRTTAPCLLPQAPRAPAARCAGWRQAQSPGRSSATPRRRPGRRAPPHAALRRRRQHDDLACAARRKPCLVALTSASVRSSTRSRPTSTRNRARCDSSACLPSEGVRRACSSARLRAGLHPARVQARTIPGASRARPPWLRPARHGGRRPRPAPSTPGALRPPRAGGRSSPRAIRRAAGVLITRDALSTSAVSAGIFASRAARSARASARVPSSSAGVASRSPQPPARGRPSTRVGAGGVELGERALGLVEAADQEQAPDLEIARMRGIYTVAVHFERARAASSAFAGQVRSRETSAISASATIHLARATASFGPNPRAARRRRAFARTRSPSCAIAMPRSARRARRHAGRPSSGRRGDHPGERTRRGRDQRVHRDPATLVTLAFR